MVQASFDGRYKTDQVDVKVEKGAVTIVAARRPEVYYLGEEVKFSGTNTESVTPPTCSSSVRTCPKMVHDFTEPTRSCSG